MNLKFCNECAAPLSKKSSTEYHCPNSHIFWNNPKACAAVVIMQGQLVLFAKRGIEPNKGKYDLPGGFLEYDEDIFEAAKREVREECELEISDLVLLTAISHTYIENISACDIVILARTWTGTPRANDDVAALEWKSIDFMDSVDFAPPYHGVSSLIKNS